MLQKKWFLYLTEFFAGLSVMAVETGASRLLAPYFSSSQIVWTIIIGTIMIAMALGNLWGGRTADKKPNPSWLYLRILIAAVWIALIPVVGKYIIAFVAMIMALIVSSNYLVWASFLACILLFVFPLMLLANTTPALVRYVMDTAGDAGRTVGRMNALNTIGSIIGTFLPTFVTIPAMGTSLTFICFAVVLLLLSLLYFLPFIIARASGWIKNLVRCAVCTVLVIAAGIVAPMTGFAFWEKDVYEDESIYNYLKVTEDEREISLSTNVMIGVQSVKMKKPGLTGSYYDYAMAAPYMSDSLREGRSPRVLILGLGSGTYATECLCYLPGCSVEGVEIDQKIVDLAYDRFDMPREVVSHTEDGRAFLNLCRDKYDVIMVDAYKDVTIPFQMSSVEFFEKVKGCLSEGGVMVVNLNMQSDKEGAINQYLCETIASVFDSVLSSNCYDGGNRVVFAAAHDRMESNLNTTLPDVKDAALRASLSVTRSKFEAVEKGDHILTDDKAPVEVLGMKVVNELIFDQLNAYKEYYLKIFREKGLRGLFEELTGN